VVEAMTPGLGVHNMVVAMTLGSGGLHMGVVTDPTPEGAVVAVWLFRCLAALLVVCCWVNSSTTALVVATLVVETLAASEAHLFPSTPFLSLWSLQLDSSCFLL